MKREARKSSLQRMKDAEEFLSSAEDNLLKGRYKACVDNAVDAVIAANDALTIWFLEAVATRSHREAIVLHSEVGRKIGKSRVSLLRRLLELRHRATYRPVKIDKNTAQKTLKSARSFVLWVKFRLKL
jgi:uncharacterized protein (UPF0332 family)